MKRAAVENTRSRILIVDDHPLVRTGLRLLIDCESDLSVCGEAANATEAMRLLESQKPDLLIVDLSLKESSGLELIKRIKTRNTEVKILVSSMFKESLYAERVLSAGALGYVHKQEGMDRVIEAIRCVLSGRVWLSTAMSDRMLRKMTISQAPPSQ